MSVALLALLLSSSADFVKGLVEISPSMVAPVCQVGDQLELTCNTTSGLSHSWELITNPDRGAATSLQTISSVGTTGVDSTPVVIGSSMFTFARISAERSLPLISRVLINPISEGLNGSQVSCVASESATTTILIIGDTPPAKPSIQPPSQQFFSNSVLVILEWTISNSLGRYQQLLLPNFSVSVAPNPEGEIVFVRNLSIQLTLPYNTLYNVSITQPGICGQTNQTTSIELNYTKCYDPEALITADLIIIEGYEEPALEGANITFRCHGGRTLIGPNSATCVRNGEWEPDPSEAECTPERELETTGTIMPTTHISHKIIGTPDSSPATATAALTLRTALISVTCILVMVSILTFIIGFACGHCFSQRWRKSPGKKDESPTNPTTDPKEDLELKENVAYITIHPK